VAAVALAVADESQDMMRSSKNLPSALAIALALLLAAGTRASAGTDAGAAPSSSGTAEGIDGGTFYSPLPPKVQEDLGDIRPAANAGFLSYFHGQATVSGQYTSNAPLYHSRDEADFLILPAFQGGFTAPLNKYFKLDLEARIEDFTYASHQTLGFWGASGNADLEYRYKPVWPRLYAGIEPYYYLSYASGNRLTAALGPVAGIDQTVSVDRGKTLLLMGYHFGQYYASPGIDTRQSHTATLALTQQIRPDLYAQIYWQGEYSIYTEGDRDEMRDVVGVSLIHQLCSQAYLSVFVNYVNNASNNTLAKYETVNAGVGVTWQY
jgi:hypothetical protein